LAGQVLCAWAKPEPVAAREAAYLRTLRRSMGALNAVMGISS
jgi:hypothetical protein